jgi:two-component system OmpR family sensor kinase
VRRFGTLRWRLTALYAVVAAVMLLLVLVIGGAAVEAALVRSTAERLEIEAGLLVADAEGGRRGPRATDLAAGDLATVLGGRGTAVVILGGDGETLATEPNGATAPIVGARLGAADYAAALTSGESVTGIRRLPDGERVLMVAAPVELRTAGPGNGNGNGNGRGLGNGNGRGLGQGLGNQNPGGEGAEVAEGPPNAVAQLAISLSAIDATLGQLRLVVGGVAAVVLVLAAAVAWWITRRGLGPLDRIAGTAGRIANGDLAARTSLRLGDDEVGRLARAFDGMADRVDSTMQAQRQFAADASHELRSPLTVLGGYVDVLARGDLDPETRARTLDAMRREIDRLTRLSSDLLLLTQLEAGGGRLAPRMVDLGELVEDIGAAARIMGPTHHVEVDRNGAVPVVADPDRLTQALMNLVDNAVRHTPSGGQIRLSAERRDGMAVADVRNDGQAIAPEDLEHLFDRFYQVADGSMANNGHHAGLGLAIVKAIAEASGGSVAAASDARGTRFSILLPAVDQPSEAPSPSRSS